MLCTEANVGHHLDQRERERRHATTCDMPCVRCQFISCTPSPLSIHHQQRDPGSCRIYTDCRKTMSPQSSSTPSCTLINSSLHSHAPHDADNDTRDSPTRARLRSFMVRATRHLVRIKSLTSGPLKAPRHPNAYLRYLFPPTHASI